MLNIVDGLVGYVIVEFRESRVFWFRWYLNCYIKSKKINERKERMLLVGVFWDIYNLLGRFESGIVIIVFL